MRVTSYEPRVGMKLDKFSLADEAVRGLLAQTGLRGFDILNTFQLPAEFAEHVSQGTLARVQDTYARLMFDNLVQPAITPAGGFSVSDQLANTAIAGSMEIERHLAYWKLLATSNQENTYNG